MEDQLSTSSSTPSSSYSITCEVCNCSGHGIHFGVVTCRACAAFFRRTIVEKCHNRYKCRGGSNDCGVAVNRRHQCRLCRFNKCIYLGMTPDNIQLDRDPDMIANEKSDLESDAFDIEYPTTTKLRKKKKKKIIDTKPLETEIQRILNEDLPFPPEFQSLSKLEQIKYALKDWRIKQKDVKKIKYLKELPILKLFTFLDEQKLSIARFLAHSPDFRLLDAHQRYEFFKHTIGYLQRLERVEMSTRMYGAASETETKFAISYCSSVSSETSVRWGKVTERTDEEMNRIFCDSRKEQHRKSAKGLLELQPKSIEVAFMLGELAWRIAGTEMQGETLQISENVRDELANDLHVFYQNSRNQQNYAMRMIKLLKSVSVLMEVHAESKKTMELAHLFDVFNQEPSELAFFGN